MERNAVADNVDILHKITPGWDWHMTDIMAVDHGDLLFGELHKGAIPITYIQDRLYGLAVYPRGERQAKTLEQLRTSFVLRRIIGRAVGCIVRIGLWLLLVQNAIPVELVFLSVNNQFFHVVNA